jgi:transcription elongation factor GreB
LGVDEADTAAQQISWGSPVARALLKSRVGDVVRLQLPSGWDVLEVVEVSYPAKG